MNTFQQNLSEHTTALEKLQRRAEDAENALREAKASFEQEKQAWKAEMEQQVEDEKHRSHTNSGAQSPANTFLNGLRGSLTPEFLGFQDQLRKPSIRSINGANFNEITTPERLISRRSSAQPAMLRNIKSSQGPLNRQDSIQSFDSNNVDGRGFAENNVPQTPSIHTSSVVQENDDFTDYLNGASQSSPQTINDMVSVSTVAGPSVQVLERMSAIVRRVESEKVGYQEEMTRLGSQRDEARKEIAALMQEVEAKRAGDEKIKDLEGEVALLNERLSTALEMLGEKTERVEELSNDVMDVKQMLKDLVESSTK